MIDKIKIAIEAAKALGSLGVYLMDAIHREDWERVDAILPPEDRARIHLLALEEKARRDLPPQ